MWTTTGQTVRLFARCGAEPTPSSYFTSTATSATGYLDLTSGCASGWQVTARNTSVSPVAVHVRVGASAGSNRDFDLVVGIEHPATAGEVAYIRKVLRETAWLFYGVTGGSHRIRTLTYNSPGNCGGAHFCWRNTTGCTQGTAITHPTGGFPDRAIDFCQDVTGRTAATAVGLEPNLAAHEFGHLLTTNGVLNHLGDEYWTSDGLAPICGVSGWTINQCTHTLMSTTWTPRMASLCVTANHTRVNEVWRELPAGGAAGWVMAVRTDGLGGTNTTATECNNGGTNYAGPVGSPGWTTLANTGAAQSHPSWSPDNFDFLLFANNVLRTEIGRNIP
jgi:hypothetical protein